MDALYAPGADSRHGWLAALFCSDMVFVMMNFKLVSKNLIGYILDCYKSVLVAIV